MSSPHPNKDKGGGTVFFSGDLFWLVMIVILCVIEGITFALVCIWFAGGALLALISAALGASAFVQYTVFLLVSGALLFLTRPVVMKYLITKKTSTNADRLIGKRGRVTKTISALDNVGEVKVLGQTWSAKSRGEGAIIAEGKIIEVLDISGSKLIVEERGSRQDDENI